MAQVQSDMPAGMSQKRLMEIFQILKEQPTTTANIAERLELSPDVIMPYMNLLLRLEQIEPIKRTYYYRLTKWKYSVFTTDARKIYEPLFQELPLIKDWMSLARNNQWQRQLIKDFYRICTGQVVDHFARLPEHWVFPETPMQFLDLYREQYDSHPPKNITKAISAFLSICLKVTPQEITILHMHYSDGQDGQYRFIKLSAEELQKAKDWLKTEGIKLVKEGLQKDELLAHFAFQLETFGRPSRVLTIETDRVEKVTNNEYEHPSLAGYHIELTMLETKQNTRFKKMIFDPELYEWAAAWLDKRKTLHCRYLFIDEPGYVPMSYDTHRLSHYRERFATIYKEMFKALGKTEPYFYTDTLYSLRHCGVQLWFDRLGANNLSLISDMGWTDERTLRQYYLGINGREIVKLALKAIRIQSKPNSSP